ncbi:MAG: hypothetical protein IIA12_06645, partial [Proteobacteria bacterium]|nr:hypothetical protein [Pseudomonadota bacterium]
MSMPAEHITRTITLADLLQGFADAPALPISGIASDSRQLRRGFLFLACPGISSHGADYLDQAIEAGVARLVGSDAETITRETRTLLTDQAAYERMARVTNPF